MWKLSESISGFQEEKADAIRKLEISLDGDKQKQIDQIKKEHEEEVQSTKQDLEKKLVVLREELNKENENKVKQIKHDLDALTLLKEKELNEKKKSDVEEIKSNLEKEKEKVSTTILYSTKNEVFC